MENIFIIAVFLVFNLLIYVFFPTISNIVNIFDNPDNIRKIHKYKTATLGGLLIYLNLILVAIVKLLNPEISFFVTNLINSSRNFITFFMMSTSIFLIGIFDDKYGIRATKKLFICSLIFLIYLQINPDFQINTLRLTFFNDPIYLYDFSIIFSIICFLLFINALNMFDGINLQSGIYTLILFIFLYINQISDTFSLVMIISLIIFLILNFKERCFLGDSGSYILAFIISVIFIHYYNLQYHLDDSTFTLYADSIFILMMIPGLDMLRLCVFRLYNGKSPFEGDKQHLHHLLLEKYGFYKTTLIIQSLIIIPILCMNIMANIYIIIIGSFAYFLLIFFIYRKIL